MGMGTAVFQEIWAFRGNKVISFHWEESFFFHGALRPQKPRGLLATGGGGGENGIGNESQDHLPVHAEKKKKPTRSRQH